MVYYGDWQPPQEHVWRWNVLGGTGDSEYLTGPETPDSGLNTAVRRVIAGGAWYAKTPLDPRQYQDPSVRADVYEAVQAGLFQNGPKFPTGPGEVGLDGNDAWHGEGPIGTIDIGYRFVGSVSPGALSSGFEAHVNVVTYTLLWDPSDAEPFYPPDESRWPDGAIDVDFDPAGELIFQTALLLNSLETERDLANTDGDVTPVVAYRYPDSGLFHAYAKGDPVTPDPPSMYKAAPVAAADTEIPNFDGIRLYQTGGLFSEPDHEKEVTVLLGPAGFLPGAANPADADDPGVGSLVFGTDVESLLLEVTFTTAAYRYVYDSAPYAPPLRLKQRDDDLGNTARLNPSSHQRSLRVSGYL